MVAYDSLTPTYQASFDPQQESLTGGSPDYFQCGHALLLQAVRLRYESKCMHTLAIPSTTVIAKIVK